MFRFSIDRGGTFTDVYAECPGGKTRVLKLLSEDPANYPDAPREAIRRIMQEELGETIPQDQLLDSSRIEWIRMGTTVATNALLERKGERMALVITRGFRDLLHIGNQSRPRIFDLRIEVPDVLYEEVVEAEERVVLAQDSCQLGLGSPTITGTTGEKLHVLTELNKESLRRDLQKVLDKGITSLSVVLMHSYTFAAHEEAIRDIAMEMGFSHVSLSSAVMPMVRIVQRGYTACADGYLTPCIYRYVQGFASGFKDPEKLRVLFMQSDGGLTPMDKFNGSHAILSGPAGGVVGYAVTSYDVATMCPVIGFDMGGTSTDVSRYDGEYEHVFESTTAGVTIQAPQLDINTVAAGGGSMLFFRSGMFVVGPESAGANPGPTCYGKGGPLTVTDANLCLGRLLPDYFPRIFGPNEDEPLNREATMKAFSVLTQQVNDFLSESGSEPMTVQEVAMGFVRVANEAMCRPIRALTQGKGYDTSRHQLACFGGAGGQHACSIARSLGMSTVFIHRYSGILSAYGLALADVVHEAQEPCAKVYNAGSYEYIDSRINELTQQCLSELEGQGFARESVEVTPYLHMRYERTDCALMCTPVASSSPQTEHGDFHESFIRRYQREFGFTIPSRPIIVDDIRVRATGRACSHNNTPLPPATGPAPVETVTECCFETGSSSTNVYLLEKLGSGHKLPGPAIIIDKNCTILVEPFCEATVTQYGDVVINIGGSTRKDVGTELDTIQLSIFSHRFMSTAEQMGRVLQRTAISTNIKERLDFSCALFGPDGGLVANAPHIPVHLGAMQEAVQWQLRYLQGDLREGDVLLSNHPASGGSHLPDLTVITPVFYTGYPKPVFFVASRGHHADIGGLTPGSMPPHSTELWQEGMNVKSFKLVRGGVFQEEGVTRLLQEPGKYPGSSGTRNLHDNLSDLRAQVAANQKGILLVKELIDAYGLEVVQAYMSHIQENAEVAVRDMLKTIATNTKVATGQTTLSAVDHMDDGSPIKLAVAISDEGSALFDFAGTGPQVAANTNAPRAVVLSALIYCLRCMIGHDVPLNQGCLKPVQVSIPPGCLLDPSDTAAVVGGNVLTSQRIVDVVFSAFGACAASQGCMNNITFGDKSVGYYETVAGGAGAGPDWDGRSGVHSHMTNTRITDPEILERRYPAVLKCFQLNRGTGGDGQFRGGDGVLREITFRRSLTLSILTERRVYSPYGLKGGCDGRKGKNTLIKVDKSEVDLGPKTAVDVQPGETYCLESPGGGGYGPPGEMREPPNKKQRLTFTPSGSVANYQRAQESA